MKSKEGLKPGEECIREQTLIVRNRGLDPDSSCKASVSLSVKRRLRLAGLKFPSQF